MKRIIVHQEPLKKNYSIRSRLSIAYLFVITCNIFVLIVPYYVWKSHDENTDNFWMTHSSYREQPDVSFLYKLIIVLQATSRNDRGKEIYVSTIDSVNALRHDTFRMSKIQSKEVDSNLDGIVDWFELEVDIPLMEDEEVKSMQALAFFDYQLKHRVKIGMESMAYVSIDSSLPLSGYDTEGDLIFRQRNPLGSRGYLSKTLYANETPLVRTDMYRASNSNVGDILSRYRSRDIAADYVERYPTKRLDMGEFRHGSGRNYRFKMKIRVPNQDIRYIPNLMEVLKNAWVKYVSVAILCWVLLDRFQTFVFSHHWV